MNTSALVFLFVLNFGISWFNAWAVGVGWVESKFNGGRPRFMAWCGAVMSACGFTWCLCAVGELLASLVVARFGHPISAPFLRGFCSFGYLVAILPVLGSGLGLAVNSWALIWRRHMFGGGGVVTAWNTFTQISNMMKTLNAIPNKISGIVDALTGGKDEDPDSSLCRLIFLYLIAVCLFGGILLTRHIVLSTARKHFDHMRSALRHARQP